MICPYCQQEAKLIAGDELYPHRPDLHLKKFYRCDPCDAHVGTHKGTDKPLGTLANAELRKERGRAHEAFDVRWRGRNQKTRSEAYAWLADRMAIPVAKCHIGMFTVEQCRQVVNICRRT